PVLAHQHRGNRERDPATLEDIKHCHVVEYALERRAQRHVALSHEPTALARAVDGAALAGDPRASDDSAGTGPGDQIEATTQVERRFAPDAGELIGKAPQKGCCVDAPHSPAVEAEHPIRPPCRLILLAYRHLRDLPSLTTPFLLARSRPYGAGVQQNNAPRRSALTGACFSSNSWRPPIVLLC
ncbi:hypothetical protein E4T56_gene10076, partial [Termitomyces sp. T112]